MVFQAHTPRETYTRIKINDNYYVIAGEADVETYTVPSLGDAFRIQGTQRRLDNRKVNRFTFNGWSENGIGHQRVRREHEGFGGSMRDADMETRFPSAVTLPYHAQSVTHTAGQGDDHLASGKAFVHFLGDLWALMQEHNSASTDGDIGVFKFEQSGDAFVDGVENISEVGDGDNDDYARAFALEVFDGYMYALHMVRDDSENRHQFKLFKSNNGTSWSKAEPGANPWNQDLVSDGIYQGNSGDHKNGALLSLGSLFFVAVHNTNASPNDIRVFSTGDPSAGTPSYTARGTVSTITYGTNLVAWGDPFTAGHPAIAVLICSQGVFKVNTSSNACELILPLSGVLGDGLAAARGIATGGLYVGTKNGDILELMVTGFGSIQVRNIGPESKGAYRDSEGMVADRKGYATFIYGDNPTWLFVGYGGNSSGKYASILAMNYKTGAWHSVWKDATADREVISMIISNEDDGASRLHWGSEGASASAMFHIEYPLVSQQTQAHTFETTGYIEFAEDDLGDPNISSAIFRGLLDAADLTTIATGVAATDTTIELEYGLDGAGWTNVTNLGFFVDADKELQFGKTNQNTQGSTEAGTPVGVSAKTIRMKLTGSRDDSDSSKTFVVRDVELQVRTKNDVLKGIRVPIDIAKTAEHEGEDVETIHDRIDTIIESVTLVPVEWGETSGSATTLYMEAMPPSQGRLRPVYPDGAGLGAPTQQTKRAGIRTLTLEEVL